MLGKAKILAVTVPLIFSTTLYAETSSDKSENTIKNEIITPLSVRNAKLYSKIVGNNKPVISRHRQEQGYTIENVRFKNANGVLGSAVFVTSQDGSILAILELPKKKGLLTISPQGKEHFLDISSQKKSYANDAVLSQEHVETSPATAAEQTPQSIEVLVTYSTYALNKLNVDPLAYALAQMETVNAGLENSKIDEVRVILGGVVFLDVGPEYDTSATGLPLWEAIMKPYRKLYQTDLSMAITQAGGYNGKAYLFSYTSVNAWYSPTTFRHEIGHNVGGSHCNHELNDYKFGYGKTFLCGNERPYYSNINVKDDDGQPLGDKNMADMARLWKEQSNRLVNYNPSLDGVKLFFLSRGESKIESLRLDTSSSSAKAGFVALSTEVGPTELQDVSSGGATTLTVKLKNIKNEEYPVNFRAQRAIGSCPKGVMNRNVKCNGGGGLFLTFSYYPQDNLSLPEGTYNGLLKLQAKDSSDANYIKPINIPIALEKKPTQK